METYYIFPPFSHNQIDLDENTDYLGSPVQSPLKIIREEYPRISVRVKGKTTSYGVDCRAERWTGQKYFSFQSKTYAISKPQEVAKAVDGFGISAII